MKSSKILIYALLILLCIAFLPSCNGAFVSPKESETATDSISDIYEMPTADIGSESGSTDETSSESEEPTNSGTESETAQNTEEITEKVTDKVTDKFTEPITESDTEPVTEPAVTEPHVHSYKETVTLPSCTAEGYTEYHCDCGESFKGNYTNALGHNLKTETTNATCTRVGIIVKTCVRCAYEETSLIPKKDHDYGAWVCVKEAQNGIKGQEKQVCRSCNVTNYRDIPALKFKFTQASVTGSAKIPEYGNFNSFSSPSLLVPGLKEYFIPQGMDIWKEKDWVMVSGYFPSSDKSPCSVIMAIDIKTGRYVGEYYLRNSDGSYHASHAGGLAITEKNLFISNGGKLFRIPLESFKNAGYQGEVKIVDSISVPSRASFCNYSGGYLWVGDFYYGTAYPTEEYAHMENSVGKMHYAFSVGYKLDATSESEFSSEKWNSSLPYATPDVILSIDQKIQGFAVVSDECIALSQSYGRNANSKIYLYNNILGTKPHKNITMNGKEIPLWFLDESISCVKYTAMPMSEGLAVKDGKLYILFESGADKYRNGGGKDPTDRIWIMNIPTRVENTNLRIMTNNVWNNVNNLPDWEAIGEDCSEIVRSHGFAAVYAAYRPDIINFQEMSPTMVEYILEDLKELGVTYSLLSFAKTTPKDDTCLIYNPETVTLLDSGHHIYEYGSNKNSKSYTWGLFELKSNGKRFISLSTHLWWKSEAVQEGSNEWRRQQAAEIVALSEVLIAKYNCPMFVQGDFNTQTTSTAFKEFKDGGFKLCHDIATVEKDSLRGHHKCDKSGYSTTMYPGDYTYTAIDHMLVKNQGNAEVLAFKHIVADFYYKLSDHFPLYIDINLK